MIQALPGQIVVVKNAPRRQLRSETVTVRILCSRTPGVAIGTPRLPLRQMSGASTGPSRSARLQEQSLRLNVHPAPPVRGLSPYGDRRAIIAGLPVNFYDESAVAASAPFAGVCRFFLVAGYSRAKAITQSVVVLTIETRGVLVSRDPADFGTSILVSVGILLGLKNGTFHRLGYAVALYSLILDTDVLTGNCGASWRSSGDCSPTSTTSVTRWAWTGGSK